MSVNENLQRLNAAWLDGVLRRAGHSTAAVADVAVEPVAFSGATTDMARLRIRYVERAGSGPASLIAKIRGTKPIQMQIDQVMGLYAREVRFYRELSREMPVRTPAYFFAGDGDTTPLLLEDLGDLRMGDQREGLQLDDAGTLMDALADIHAAFWESPTLQSDWLVNPTEGVVAEMLSQVVASGAAAVAERFAGRVSGATLESVAELATDWTRVLNRCAEGPATLAHNDVRLDNVFFTNEGAPVLIDWQTLARTRGTQDVANLLAGSMNSDDLNAHWRALVGRYHYRLSERGVTGYGLEECVEHYRQSVIYPLGQGMALLGALDTGDDRGVGDISVLRCLEHIEAVEALATL